MKNLIIYAVFCFVTYSCESVLWVTGVVTDSNNVLLDSVVVSDGTFSTYTDSIGKFKFMKVVGGTRLKNADFTFSKKGFVTSKINLKVNTDKAVNVVLQKEN